MIRFSGDLILFGIVFKLFFDFLFQTMGDWLEIFGNYFKDSLFLMGIFNR
jgi:hypothetical protein